jgi:hypothetical protein
MTAKNVDVTRVNPLHKICCNIQKTDHMMGTIEENEAMLRITTVINKR